MSVNSKIEWLKGSNGIHGATLNPFVGCSKISEACTNCYAEKMAWRLKNMGIPAYQNVVTDNGWTGKLATNRSQLGKLQRWKKPRRVFMCSMSDIFHEKADSRWIDDILDSCIASPQHTYIFLTKRPQNIEKIFPVCTGKQLDFLATKAWIGVTVENQQRADERIPILLQIPAAVRFVSIEPYLEYIDLENIDYGAPYPLKMAALSGYFANHNHMKLDWVICGGETGPRARPMHPDWVRSLRDQCVESGTPFFFKSWGEWGLNWLNDDEGNKIEGSEFIDHMGKKNAGRILDGQTWDQFPKG